MRILITISRIADGGAERAATTLANTFAERGHSVVILTLSPAQADAYALDARVQHVGLDLMSDSKGITDALVNTHRRVRRIREVMKDVRPDLVVSMMPAMNIMSILASIFLRVPVIICERTYPPADYLGRVWETLRRTVYPMADILVVQTEIVQDWARRHVPRLRTTVIPNAVTYPVPKIHPILPVLAHVQHGRKLLLAAGRLEHKKGFDLLVPAFAAIADRYPDWDLVIIGQGSHRSAITEMADRSGLSRRVHLPGRAGNIQDWYDAADVFVLSSRAEGFPNALLEAMASGCAAVSFDCKAGPSDIIEHGRNGLLVPPEAGVEGLSKALAEMMGNEALRQECGRNATETRERFGLERTCALWENLFADVVAQSRR